MIHQVKLSKRVLKLLAKLPRPIVIRLMAWVQDIEQKGIDEVRKRPGYHDEALKGRRKHQRSIRLSLAYRAIYEIVEDGAVEFVIIEEVSKHDY